MIKNVRCVYVMALGKRVALPLGATTGVSGGVRKGVKVQVPYYRG